MREEIEIIHPQISEQLPRRDARSHPIVFQTELSKLQLKKSALHVKKKRCGPS
jgi:hypothetical protein